MPKILLFQNTDEYKSVPAGHTIFAEGELGEYMYVVVDGEVNIVSGGKVLETVTAGDVFGEMALIDHHPRSASAIAKTDARVVSISQKRFTFMVEQTPYFALQVMQIMAERLRRANLGA